MSIWMNSEPICPSSKSTAKDLMSTIWIGLTVEEKLKPSPFSFMKLLFEGKKSLIIIYKFPILIEEFSNKLSVLKILLIWYDWIWSVAHFDELPDVVFGKMANMTISMKNHIWQYWIHIWPKTRSGSSPNCDILKFWKNMSDHDQDGWMK